jgi:hypothetical protein
MSSTSWKSQKSRPLQGSLPVRGRHMETSHSSTATANSGLPVRDNLQAKPGGTQSVTASWMRLRITQEAEGGAFFDRFDLVMIGDFNVTLQDRSRLCWRLRTGVGSPDRQGVQS